MPRLAGKVFLSYRREESRHLAGRLADRISAEFAHVEVFMDVDTIAPGEDFSQAISQAVSACDLLLALIGPKWLQITDAHGRRRLDDVHDWVRREIGAALERDIRVIPVLIDEARMPGADDLPAELLGLARRNLLRIDHETFSTDIHRLLGSISDTLTQVSISKSSRTQPIVKAKSPASLARRSAADRKVPGSTRRPVSLYRSALRIALWVAAFLLAFFSAVGLGVTLGGRVVGGVGANVIAAILYGFFSIGLLVGLLLWIRKETARQRDLVNLAAEKAGVSARLPASLTAVGIRTLAASLASVFIAFLVLAWLT